MMLYPLRHLIARPERRCPGATHVSRTGCCGLVDDTDRPRAVRAGCMDWLRYVCLVSIHDTSNARTGPRRLRTGPDGSRSLAASTISARRRQRWIREFDDPFRKWRWRRYHDERISLRAVGQR